MIFLGFVAVSSASAMETEQPIFSIKPHEMLAYVQSMPQPENIKDLMAWAEQNQDFLHQLIPANKDVVVNLEFLKDRAQFKKGNVLLESAGYANVSDNNFIFDPFKTGKQVVKSTGPGSRAIKILHSNKNPETGQEYGWQMDKLTDDLIKWDTYQTPSILAGYLATQQVIKDKGIQSFKVPNTYLLPIPGRAPFEEKIVDENSFVVQEMMDLMNYVSLKDNLSIVGKISDQTLKDLVVLSKEGAPLWAFYDNAFINKDDFTVGYTDLEEANNNRRWQFYRVDKNRREYDTLCSLKELNRMTLEAQKAGHDVSSQINQLRTMILSDAPLKQSSQWGNIEKAARAETLEQLG